MSRPRALLCDIDGVLTVSWQALPGAVEALTEMRATGIPLVFVTNTTSTTRAMVATRLTEAGFRVDPEEVFTAPRAAAGYLGEHRPGARCLLVNHGEVGEDLARVAFRALGGGASLVAMHRNLDWQTPEGLQLDMGAFIVGLEQAAGVTATVVGKPSPAFFGAVLAELGVAPADALMIGDDIDADVLGAQASGIGGGLVRTGKVRAEG